MLQAIELDKPCSSHSMTEETLNPYYSLRKHSIVPSCTLTLYCYSRRLVCGRMPSESVKSMYHTNCSTSRTSMTGRWPANLPGSQDTSFNVWKESLTLWTWLATTVDCWAQRGRWLKSTWFRIIGSRKSTLAKKKKKRVQKSKCRMVIWWYIKQHIYDGVL